MTDKKRSHLLQVHHLLRLRIGRQLRLQYAINWHVIRGVGWVARHIILVLTFLSFFLDSYIQKR